MIVTNKITVKRLDGQSYFKRKCEVEIVSADSEGYGSNKKKMVTIRITTATGKVEITVDAREVTFAVENAGNLPVD